MKQVTVDYTLDVTIHQPVTPRQRTEIINVIEEKITVFGETSGTFTIELTECPQGGDETDCDSCISSSDHRWDNEKKECVRK